MDSAQVRRLAQPALFFLGQAFPFLLALFFFFLDLFFSRCFVAHDAPIIEGQLAELGSGTVFGGVSALNRI